ncbi:iron-regulated frpC domain protein [Neisseria meningitidis 9506]|nr:iron-regulated frpC domain protein [Neisseria meningitidis 9506]
MLDAYTGQDSNTLYYMSEEDALNIVKVTNDTYDHLAKNIYQNLLFQTRLQPYLNQISFKMENDTFTLDLVVLFKHLTMSKKLIRKKLLWIWPRCLHMANFVLGMKAED